MNLLPKSHEEFSQVDYWNKFFKKRGQKSFEWYGEYPELCNHLVKYIKYQDDILVTGCGNSTLSMSLYDVGYRNITNIDISKVVIKQMQDINKSERPELVYEQMDATKMSYADEKFSVVLDKGTLDALMVDSKAETVVTVDLYFNEIARVLRKGGRYICISLLQEHILKKLLSYFPQNGFAFRIARCHEAEDKARQEEGSSIPVFMIVATKFIKLNQPILEVALANGPPERVSTPNEVSSLISAAQHAAFICNNLHKKNVADVGEVSLEIHRPGDKDPRYTVYILDQRTSSSTKSSYAAFIVPQGRETDWLFGTKEGRQQLLKTAGHDRLAIVVLRREHIFENLDSVKEELASSIRNLAPPGFSSTAVIPYLSVGEDVGKRTTCHRGTSALSGPFVVEEIEKDPGELYRRLIFLGNQFVVQSEAKLKLAKSRRGKEKKIIDPGFLACEHHIYMSMGVSLALRVEEDNEILIIGLGGGGLCTFLHECFPKLNITAVEIDEAMLKVASEYFGLKLDERMKVEITDGIGYIERKASQGDHQFQAILFDVDSKDTSYGLSCPPKEFLDVSVLTSVSKCLTKDGLFILNLVSRDETLKVELRNRLKTIFPFICSQNIEHEVNEILICSKIPQDNETEMKEKIKKAATNLNVQSKSRKLNDDEIVCVSSLLEGLTMY